MSVAPSITWPLVAIRPSLRMKKPVPMPRTGVSLGPLPPCPYMRSRNSRKGSLAPPRAVVATIPTTAGIDDFTSAAMETGGAVGRSFSAGGKEVEDGLRSSGLPGHRRGDRSLCVARVEATLQPGEREREQRDHRQRERPAPSLNPEQFRHRRRVLPRPAGGRSPIAGAGWLCEQ